MKRFISTTVFILILAGLIGACSSEVAFDQNIDIQMDAVSGSGSQSRLVFVSESDIMAGLEDTGYTLSEYDNLVLTTAQVSAPFHSGWDGVSSLHIVFSNDAQQFDVLSGQNFSAGTGDIRSLGIAASDLLSLFRSRSFFVGVSGDFIDTPAILLRIHLAGELINHIP